MTTSVLSACKLFGKCADDLSVLELLQKMFCKNKNGNKLQQSVMKTEQKLKITATTVRKKERLIGS